MNRIDGPLGRFIGKPRNLIVCTVLGVILMVLVWTL